MESPAKPNSSGTADDAKHEDGGTGHPESTPAARTGDGQDGSARPSSPEEPAPDESKTTQPPSGKPKAERPEPDKHGAAEPEAAERRPNRFIRFLKSLGKTVATLLILGVAIVAGILVWDYYVRAPWTRDGRIRVQVASIAPQISGQITEVRVRDNQFVQQGDVLYVVDQFDFRASLASAQAMMRVRAADLQVKQQQAERRNSLSNLSTTVEDTQIFTGNAAQAQAMFDQAQVQAAQAEINLKRTEVRSTVNGYITNLLLRVGDYASEGSTNISIIDTDSYWIDGYFEETKMAQVCVGDRAAARLMGYARPIVGRVETITRGISVSNATPSTQGLPNVDPVYTWVRLAQRVPVRIQITDVPQGVPLVAGMTVTVSILDAEPSRPAGSWLQQRYARARQRLTEIFYRPMPRQGCVPVSAEREGDANSIPELRAPSPVPAESLNPGLAPGMDVKPYQTAPE